MPKTVIEKSPSPSPGVTVFSVSGTLGFHEKETLARLFEECARRNLNRVVLNVEGLTSLGGGCAKIIRTASSSGGLALGVVGAKPTVLKFLKDEGQIVISDTVEDAAATLAGIEVVPGAGIESLTAKTGEPAPEATAVPSSTGFTTDGESTIIILGLDPVENGEVEAGAEETPAPTVAETGAASPQPKTQAAKAATPRTNDTEAEFTSGGGTGNERKTVLPAKSSRAAKPTKADRPVAAGAADARTDATPRELQKRIVQYNTLFSLNSDLYRIQDRNSLLELFLLTTIAQVGVESAVFLEYRQGYFTPAAVKGLETSELKGFALSADLLDLESWKETLEIHTVESAPFSDEVKAPLLSLGCSYVAPFMVHNEFRGVLALGKPIKSDLDEGTKNFLQILINQAAIAYESTQRFEEEKERTLGLVQTLIALIEENTLARGNTNLLSSYTYALAKKLHYPEEHLRDLMYGTVLRDIGMIKVSDLIVRSPRELMPEEWEIIKRHPIDGTEMLRKMKFSEHAIAIVMSHHERFNGEGYPEGLQGKQIPLGARIVSVVESYAAMLQERPTRPALTQEEALNTLKENWGMRYDPDLVKAFAELVEEEIRTGEKAYDAKFELFRV
jgi:hypothetical protein